jgi:hypothetical protein
MKKPIKSVEMSLSHLYEISEVYYEFEDNYGTRVIVAVVYDDDLDSYEWGVMVVDDDPDPEADLPKFVVYENLLPKDEAIKRSKNYFDQNVA